MSELRIGEVAKRTGLRASAIRYYEELKLLPPSIRKSGSRRYDESAIERLALIEFAKEAGFTLAEIRRLIAGFTDGTRASARWHTLAQQKLEELDRASARIDAMRDILKHALRCGCLDLDECGRRIASAKHSPRKVHASAANRKR